MPAHLRVRAGRDRAGAALSGRLPPRPAGARGRCRLACPGARNPAPSRARRRDHPRVPPRGRGRLHGEDRRRRESYRLERDAEARLARLPLPPPPIGVPQATPIDPEKAPPPGSLPGTYAVDRYTEREVCRVRLAASLPDPHGRYEARLVEGCRDAGLRSFDPAAWRYDGGRLTLTSRRGHEVTLISEREDQWRRDPEVGATLILRKVTP